MADAKCTQPHEDPKSSKRPFNKKKWREERYSTKQKVQRWQEKRKTILQRQLKKQLSKEGVSNDGLRPNVSKVSKPSRLKEAQLEYERKIEDERQAAEEARRIKKEKMKKIAEYRAKKAERDRKLSQKTRKGQPIMRGRMELLQEKIEKMIAADKL